MCLSTSGHMRLHGTLSMTDWLIALGYRVTNSASLPMAQTGAWRFREPTSRTSGSSLASSVNADWLAEPANSPALPAGAARCGAAGGGAGRTHTAVQTRQKDQTDMPGRRHKTSHTAPTQPSGAGDSFPQASVVVAECKAAHAYLTPSDLAKMWRVSHDKVLAFIRTGELVAFNVASAGARRPRFRIPLAAAKEFEARRSACESARRHSPSPACHTVGKRPSPPTTYF